MMTPRERFFNLLEGKPVDRVPVWLLFPYHPFPAYIDVRNHSAYRPIAEQSLRDAITLNRRTLRAPLFAPEVKESFETLTEDGWKIDRRTLSHGSVRLYSETRRNKAGETQIKRMLNTEEDLAAFSALPVEDNPNRIREKLNEQLPAYLKEKAEFPLDAGAMMLDLGEPIAPLYHAANLLEYPVWSVTHAELIKDHLDRMMARNRIVYQYCLEHDLADVYFLVGSELAAPPMVGHETFRQWIMPYSKEIIGMVRSHGKKSIQHFHGFVKRLLPDFLDMAPDALHTIEAPPNGDCTLPEAFEITGNRLTLIGNIQYDDFRTVTEERMRAAVMRVLNECRGKRLLLSPSAGPFVPDPDVKMINNYRVFMDTASQYKVQ